MRRHTAYPPSVPERPPRVAACVRLGLMTRLAAGLLAVLLVGIVAVVPPAVAQKNAFVDREDNSDRAYAPLEDATSEQPTSLVVVGQERPELVA